MTPSASISAVADLLLHRRRRELRQTETQARQDLADYLKLSSRTLRRRLEGELRWEADEVLGLAEYFHMPLMAFYDGPGVLFVGSSPDAPDAKYGPTTRRSSGENTPYLLAA